MCPHVTPVFGCQFKLKHTFLNPARRPISVRVYCASRIMRSLLKAVMADSLLRSTTSGSSLVESVQVIAGCTRRIAEVRCQRHACDIGVTSRMTDCSYVGHGWQCCQATVFGRVARDLCLLTVVVIAIQCSPRPHRLRLRTTSTTGTRPKYFRVYAYAKYVADVRCFLPCHPHGSLQC